MKSAWMVPAAVLLLSAAGPAAASEGSAVETEMLLGEFRGEKLLGAPYAWSLPPLPDAAAEDVSRIRSRAGRFRAVVFLGTWCGDSRRHVPEFMALMEAAGIGETHIRYVGLDREKALPKRFSRYRIDRIPTFVIESGGRELGRIVETPERSLHGDLAALLERIPD